MAGVPKDWAERAKVKASPKAKANPKAKTKKADK